MALDIDKLREGLRNYYNSLEKHLLQIKGDYSQLKAAFSQFNLTNEGKLLDELKTSWQQTMQWLEEYLEEAEKLSLQLCEKINILKDIDNISDSGKTFFVTAASKIPTQKSVPKKYFNKNLNKLLPNITYVVDNTFAYYTDEESRVVNALGQLSLKKRGRNEHFQKDSIKNKDKEEGDHASHIFAQIFNGPVEGVNMLPTPPGINVGEWRNVERKWAKALENGQEVLVNINIMYENGNKRPKLFYIEYVIDNSPDISLVILNKEF